MISLNLLPPIIKQERRLTRFYIITKNLIILILILTIAIAIVLLFSKMTLQNNFNKIVDQTTLTTRLGKIFNQDIKNFNKQLIEVDNIQKGYVAWTDFLINLSELIPDDIIIYNLSINNDKILITGLATTRARLLELEDRLKNNKTFSDIKIPLDNLLAQKDVKFSIKANLDIETLK